MTLIISTLDDKGNRVLYSDKRATCGTAIALTKFNKLTTNGRYYIGGAGCASDTVLHELAIKNLTKSVKAKKPTPADIYFAYRSAIEEMFPPEGEEKPAFESQAIIVIKGTKLMFELLIVGSRVSVLDEPDEEFMAIGSGSEYARILYSYDKNIAIQAIYDTISAVDISVGKDIQIINMNE